MRLILVYAIQYKDFWMQVTAGLNNISLISRRYNPIVISVMQKMLCQQS